MVIEDIDGNTQHKLDYPLSVHVAARIQAQEYRCWYNAQKALLQLPLFALASYTEGWLVIPKKQDVLVIEHGWLTHGNHVIDPSLVLVEEEGQDFTYYPGLHFSLSQVQALPKNMVLPLAHHLSPTDELGDPDYRAAYDAALAYAERIAEGRQVEMCPAEKFLIVMEDGMIRIIPI